MKEGRRIIAVGGSDVCTFYRIEDANDLQHAANMTDTPLTPACERNRNPVLAVLKPHLNSADMQSS